MAIPKFQELQRDPAEFQKCVENPLYFYNMYMRQEGEPVLDEAQFKKRAELIMRQRTLLSQMQKLKDVTTGT